MNRKKIGGQNDNSMTIIGNLPERLQKRITSAGGGGVELANHLNGRGDDDHHHFHKNREKRTQNGLGDKHDDLDQAEKPKFVLLRRDTGNETPSMGLRAEPTTRSTSVPGLLRVKMLNNEDQQNQQQQRQLQKERKRRVNCSRPWESPRCSPSLKAHQPPSTAGDNQPPWFQALEESEAAKLQELYEQYRLLMKREKSFLQNWPQFRRIHHELSELFQYLMLHQLKFCCEHKVDTFFWKLLFYNVREHLKKIAASNVEVEESHRATSKHLSLLLDEGLHLYDQLFVQFTRKHLPGLEQDSSVGSTAGVKFLLIAKVMAQKLLICLGDLSRYKVKLLNQADYSRASEFYHRAQRLLPANGIPYNQLAIVAIQERKTFDAIYYHMRSLMSSNAIGSAKESLLVLFDDLRKKYEENELKISPLRQFKMNTARSVGKQSWRKEVWIYPDGGRRIHRTGDWSSNISDIFSSEEKRLSQMPIEELFRRFIALYLYIIGKLYTGIGMENILDHERKLLTQLTVLLNSEIFVLSRSEALKIAALNIFVMEHNMKKDTRREIRYHAFNFCNQILGIVLRKVREFLSATSGDMEADDEDFQRLNTLLQFVKVYTHWLVLNVDIWEPVRAKEHCFIDCWSMWMECWPELKRLLDERPRGTLVSQRGVGGIVLHEDQFLLGFTPLPTAASSSAALTKGLNLNDESTGGELPQFYMRLAEICEFHDCYEDHKDRLVDATSNQHESSFELDDLEDAALKEVIHKLSQSSTGASIDEGDLDSLLDSEENNSPTSVSNSAAGGDVDDDMAQLCRLKKELETHALVRQMYKAKLQEIMKDTKLYIELRPKYLMPDTNCFIDSLEELENLATEFRRYTLVIPLTVVKELDGLSKGVKLDMFEPMLHKRRIHHFDDVSSRAKKSLDFIKANKNNVKCATTKGSIINASLFALVDEEYASNDDKILATALALSKTMSTETRNEGKCLIQTELVLITTDRNLRVKALSRNLAVSELSEFLQWAMAEQSA